MKWPILFAGLLLLPLAHAGPGHDNPVAVPGQMFVHAGEPLGLHPSTPDAGFVLASESAPCAAHAWQAGFNSRPDGSGVPMLARQADLEGPVDLTWYIEWVRPGSDEPMGAPLPPLRLTAELRTAGDLSKLGDGELLADFDGSVEAVRLPGERDIYGLVARLQWTGDPVIPTSGLQLEVQVGLDAPCATLPGLRAVGADGAHPHLAWRLFDPVRIDLLSADVVSDHVHITLHASSPWGFDYMDVEPPIIQGNEGMAPAPTLMSEGGGELLEQVWRWEGRTGTYSVAARVDAADGSATSTDKVLFTLGAAPTVEEPAPAAPAEDAPGLPFLLLLAAVLVVARAQRQRT